MAVFRQDVGTDDHIPFSQGNTADTAGIAAHGADIVFIKADGHTQFRCQNNGLVAVGQAHLRQMISFHEGDGDEAVATDILKFVKDGFLDQAFFRYHKEVHRRINLIEVDEGVDLFPVGQGQDVDGSHPLRITAVGFRNFIGLQAIDTAEVGKEQDRIPRRRVEQVVNCIFIFRPHALDAAAAFILRMVYVGVDTLHVSPTRQGQNHAFIRNHVFDGKIRGIGNDFRTSFIPKFLLGIEELCFNDFHDFMFIG